MSRQRIVIIGVGLIGGSLGLALRRAYPENLEIIGVDTDQAGLDAAVLAGAVDRGEMSSAAGVAAADFVFLCTPVLQIPDLVAKIRPHLKPGAILTDVGSTKDLLRAKITALLPPDVCYIGGHPMAGREKSGIAAATESLFRDKLYILTPDEGVSPSAVERLAALVGLTGARVTVMDARRHDQAAAIISHIPHVVAAAMVNLLDGYPDEEENLLNLAGGGFCDTTRIASSNADMWADICMTNPAAIVEGLGQLQSLIAEVTLAVRQGDRAAAHRFFRTAKARRDSIIGSL